MRQAAAPWMASSLKGEARSEAWIERLQAIKPGAVLLNFARDAIVDEAAVVAAPRAGRLPTRWSTSTARSSAMSSTRSPRSAAC